MAPVAPNPKEEDWKTTKSQTDNTESQDFNSIYVRFVKETDLIKKFNIFLELHCKKDYAHLIDSDDNAGEYMREAIQAKLQEQDIKSRIDEKQKLQMWLEEQDDNEALVRLAKYTHVELDELFAKLRSLL